MSKGEVTREEMLRTIDLLWAQETVPWKDVKAIIALIEQSDKTSVNVDKHLGLVKCLKVSREWLDHLAINLIMAVPRAKGKSLAISALHGLVVKELIGELEKARVGVEE